MPKEIYCISGLGADHRVFAKLHIPGCKLNHLAWLKPGSEEPLDRYAMRLTAHIRSKRPLFLGVSFGGIVAVEIAKARPLARVAIVSSLESRHDLRSIYRLCRHLPIASLAPILLRFSPQPLRDFLFGISAREESTLLQDMIRETDPIFATWAIRQLLNWRNESAPENVFSIHGTRDRLLAGVRPDVWIENGGHLMIYNRAPDISAVLADWAAR